MRASHTPSKNIEGEAEEIDSHASTLSTLDLFLQSTSDEESPVNVVEGKIEPNFTLLVSQIPHHSTMLVNETLGIGNYPSFALFLTAWVISSGGEARG